MLLMVGKVVAAVVTAAVFELTPGVVVMLLLLLLLLIMTMIMMLSRALVIGAVERGRTDHFHLLLHLCCGGDEGAAAKAGANNGSYTLRHRHRCDRLFTVIV